MYWEAHVLFFLSTLSTTPLGYFTDEKTYGRYEEILVRIILLVLRTRAMHKCTYKLPLPAHIESQVIALQVSATSRKPDRSIDTR